uniref:Velvet domain-containing protein n=1 Tax=Parascaris univalens TaxID=6257 RepID=A0A914ZM72_PARUN
MLGDKHSHQDLAPQNMSLMTGARSAGGFLAVQLVPAIHYDVNGAFKLRLVIRHLDGYSNGLLHFRTVVTLDRFERAVLTQQRLQISENKNTVDAAKGKCTAASDATSTFVKNTQAVPLKVHKKNAKAETAYTLNDILNFEENAPDNSSTLHRL